MAGVVCSLQRPVCILDDIPLTTRSALVMTAAVQLFLPHAPAALWVSAKYSSASPQAPPPPPRLRYPPPRRRLCRRHGAHLHQHHVRSVYDQHLDRRQKVGLGGAAAPGRAGRRSSGVAARGFAPPAAAGRGARGLRQLGGERDGACDDYVAVKQVGVQADGAWGCLFCDWDRFMSPPGFRCASILSWLGNGSALRMIARCKRCKQSDVDDT